MERAFSRPGDIQRMAEGRLLALPLADLEGAVAVMDSLPDVIFVPAEAIAAIGCARIQRPKRAFKVAMDCPICAAEGLKYGLVLEGVQVIECLGCNQFLWAERFVEEAGEEPAS